MRIAIDARWIFPEISGIGAYTRELIKHLATVDTANSYSLFFDNDYLRDRTADETGFTGASNMQAHMLPYGVFSIRNQLLLPFYLKREAIDVYHSPNYMIPLLAFPANRRGSTACVVTIHDVIPMIFPHAAPRSKKSRIYPIFAWLMSQVGKKADIIISDSKASAADIIKHLRIPDSQREKVHAIYCGVSPMPSCTDRSAASKKTNTDTRILLYVGRMDPYKNLTGAIQAFAKARELCPFPMKLLVAGSIDERYPEAPRLAKKLNVDNAIEWTGYLTDSELTKAYRKADLLLHPSRYEGFGLQILEAMTCGTPVVCSNTSSLPEVAGDAAILVDPDDSDAFAVHIQRVLTDQDLAQRMSRQGREQAARFTWDKTAQQTLELYNKTGQNDA